MKSKIFLFIVLFCINLYGSNENFSNDIYKNLGKNFDQYGIVYNEEETTISFIKQDLLFQSGNTKVTKPLQIVLYDFFPKFMNILTKHRANIKKVVIKGHTSSLNKNGKTKEEKFELNRVLSQKRANSFLDFIKNIIHKEVIDNQDWIEDNFEAKGLSSAEKIYTSDGKEDLNASKRIEIQVVFYKNLQDVALEANILDPKANKTVYLADYLRQLLIENPTLKEKFNLLKSFESEISVAKSSFYPTVTLNYSYSDYSQSDPDNYTSMQNQDITIRYNIFNGFKDLDEINIQKASYKSNSFLKDQIENDLIYSLTEAFVNIKKQNEILQLAKQNLKDYDNWKSKEDVKFQNGVIALRNYAKIESRYIQQRMNYKELEKQYKDDVSTLKRYLDFHEDDISSFETLKPKNKYLEHKDIAFYDLEKYSPFIKEAIQNINLYKERYEKSSVSLYPSVNLVAKKSILDENYETTDDVRTKETTVGVEASLALYSGGKESATNEKRLFEYRQMIEKKAEVQRDVNYKLELAYNNNEMYTQKEDLLTNLVIKREDSLLGATYDYKFAKIDANDLLDIVDDLYIAKKMYIENKYNILLSKYKIFSTMGIIKNSILEHEIKE